MLLGSSVLSSMINIGGKEIQLGAVVSRAFKDSELTKEAWNDLHCLERENILVRTVYQMRAEAESENK